MMSALATMTSLSASGGGRARVRPTRSIPVSTPDYCCCAAAWTPDFSVRTISPADRQPSFRSRPDHARPDLRGYRCNDTRCEHHAPQRQGRGQGEGMKATELMIRCLENEEVRYIF